MKEPNKKVKLFLLCVSIFITMPMIGFIAHFNPIASGLIFITQIPILHTLLKEWYNTK